MAVLDQAVPEGPHHEIKIACDAVAMSGGWSPVVHLWSHCGGKLLWDAERALFRPDGAKPPTDQDGEVFVLCAGAANGALTLDAALADAALQGAGAASELGYKGLAEAPKVDAEAEAAMAAVWMMPQGAGIQLRMKAWQSLQSVAQFRHQSCVYFPLQSLWWKPGMGRHFRER